MRNTLWKWLTLVVLGAVTVGFAAEPAPKGIRTLSVMPSTDTSGLNLAGPLQTALAQLFQETGGINVQLSSVPLGGFTSDDVRRMHETLGSELLSFVYLEKERIATFLFDSSHAAQFVVATASLTDQNGTPVLTSEWIEHQFRAAYAQMLADYNKGNFQQLPGSRVDSEKMSDAQKDEQNKKADESRRLFRELSSLQDRPYYLGANIGMARMAGGGGTASTVAFGAFVGMRAMDRVRLEAGFDFFTYLLASIGARYQLPISEKYVSASVSLSAARIMTTVSQNSNAVLASLPVGQTLIGPGLNIDIPLLGTTIRGDIRFLFGGGSLFMGTYGLAYSL